MRRFEGQSQRYTHQQQSLLLRQKRCMIRVKEGFWHSSLAWFLINITHIQDMQATVDLERLCSRNNLEGGSSSRNNLEGGSSCSEKDKVECSMQQDFAKVHLYS